MKPADMSDAEADRLAKVVIRCHKDGTLTQRELQILSKIADRFYPPATNPPVWDDDKIKGGNKAKTTDPIWDSRNSDEPKITK